MGFAVHLWVCWCAKSFVVFRRRKFGREKLDCSGLVKLEVVGLVDLAPSALSELFEDPVMGTD